MLKFDVLVTETRDGCESLFHRVPAATFEEACRKVATRFKYLWIGRPRVDMGHDDFFALAIEPYKKWRTLQGGGKRTEEEIDELMAKDIERVLTGQEEEERGLVRLGQNDRYEEEWADE